MEYVRPYTYKWSPLYFDLNMLELSNIFFQVAERRGWDKENKIWVVSLLEKVIDALTDIKSHFLSTILSFCWLCSIPFVFCGAYV